MNTPPIREFPNLSFGPEHDTLGEMRIGFDRLQESLIRSKAGLWVIASAATLHKVSLSDVPQQRRQEEIVEQAIEFAVTISVPFSPEFIEHVRKTTLNEIKSRVAHQEAIWPLTRPRTIPRHTGR